MKTKNKILATALELFNKEGSEQVTTRHIAATMNISVGNLYYHYPDKQSIISQLYEQLVAELNTGFDQAQAQDIQLVDFMRAIKFTFTTLYKYRFLMLDFVHIMRSISSIKAHYQSLSQIRKAQFSYTAQELIKKKIVDESMLDIPFDYLQMQFTIMGDFWISEAEILYQGKEEDKIKYFTETMLYGFYPHFTEKGKQLFKELLPGLF